MPPYQPQKPRSEAGRTGTAAPGLASGHSRTPGFPAPVEDHGVHGRHDRRLRGTLCLEPAHHLDRRRWCGAHLGRDRPAAGVAPHDRAVRGGWPGPALGSGSVPGGPAGGRQGSHAGRFATALPGNHGSRALDRHRLGDAVAASAADRGINAVPRPGATTRCSGASGRLTAPHSARSPPESRAALRQPRPAPREPRATPPQSRATPGQPGTTPPRWPGTGHSARCSDGQSRR
jgi:hypothetical protein